MDRTQADTYLDATLAPIRDLAGVAAGAWDVVIEGALADLGIDRASTSAVADVTAYQAVLDWRGLRFLYRRLLNRVNVTLDGPSMSKAYDQAVKNVKIALDDAADSAAPYVTVGPLANAFTTGTIGIGYLEPEETYA